MNHDIYQKVCSEFIRKIFSDKTDDSPLIEYMGAYGFLTITDISPNLGLDELSTHIKNNNFDSVVELETENSDPVYGVSRSRCCFSFFAPPEENVAQVEYNQKFSLNILGKGQCSFQVQFIGLQTGSKEKANELYETAPFLFTPAARISERLSTCAIL